ncbi:MAG: substrate-binding domain-containing protein [Spirochaetia bacterium]|nr:substrate-binding domain-containing protein [Spirochaetia bacterium]
MKRVKLYSIFLTVFFLALNCGKKPISIAGDPCTVPLAEKLAEAYTKKTGIEFDIQSAGCGTGVYKAVKGEIDIGVATLEVDINALPKGTNVQVVAKAPTVLIVNKKNPINNLTIAQVKEIMSGGIENWKKVGGKDLPIKNALLQPCTTAKFSKQTAELGDNIERIYPEKKENAVEDTNKLVIENEGGLGVQIYGYEGNDVKVLTIEGALPDEETFPVKYGYYQDYTVVVKGEPKGRVKDFIDFIYTDEGQNIVASLKHIKVDK